MKLVSEIITELEKRAPSSTAEKWDNVGLLLGKPKTKTDGVVVAVDLTPEVLDLARTKGYRMIVNHHPAIFPKDRGIAKLTATRDGELTSLLLEAASDGIAVAAYHTNFDRCALEVLQEISSAFGATPIGRLIDGNGELVKLVIFVPGSHYAKVSEAVHAAGAGHIGNYDCCGFALSGTGSFRGLEGTQPFLGKKGVLEKAAEIRFETVVPRGLLPSVLQAMHATHPYEEVAYDVYSVEQRPGKKGITRGLGYGVYAELSKPMSLEAFGNQIEKIFQCKGLRLTSMQEHPLKQKVKRFGFVAGKGESFMNDARMKGCDVFVTGEASYHGALSQARSGMGVIELGHRESEIFYVKTMSSWMKSLGLKVASLTLSNQMIFKG